MTLQAQLPICKGLQGGPVGRALQAEGPGRGAGGRAHGAGQVPRVSRGGLGGFMGLQAWPRGLWAGIRHADAGRGLQAACRGL